jgi:hypothetical protein
VDAENRRKAGDLEDLEDLLVATQRSLPLLRARLAVLTTTSRAVPSSSPAAPGLTVRFIRPELIGSPASRRRALTTQRSEWRGYL